METQVRFEHVERAANVKLERTMGIEPTLSGWKPEVLAVELRPLATHNLSRKMARSTLFRCKAAPKGTDKRAGRIDLPPG